MAEIALSIKLALTDLFDEIRLSFGYYENQSGRGIDNVYISGGGANLIALEDAFREAFGLKLERWNPLSFLNVDAATIDSGKPAGVNSSFAVAAGLALR
jgi:Tfp pilus assembly PilM family ATPase